jgi:hypothetical protein
VITQFDFCVTTKSLSKVSIKPYRFAQNAAGKSKVASEIATGSSVIGLVVRQIIFAF